MTSIRFLNHASFIVEHRGTSLLCDPYLAGSAFDDGWRLLAEEHHDVSDIDWIWFSHEHPDHFSVPFLRSIPEEQRSSITVLYQDARDGRVLRFCEQLGFRTGALRDGQLTEIAPGFRLTCGQIPFYDSWLLIDLDDYLILNTNDCILESPERLKMISRRVPRCDVLFTQFSYANWTDEQKNTAARTSLATEKLRRVRTQTEAFDAHFVVPFASFVYYAHEENAYMNDSINTVRACADFISAETSATPIVLRPNETWDPTAAKDNEESLAYWDGRYDELESGRLPTISAPDSIALTDLHDAASQLRRRVAERNSMRALSTAARLGVMKPTFFRLTDHRRTLRFDWRDGLQEVDDNTAADDLTVELHSEALRFVLANDYGVDTLNVNARFDGKVSAKKAMIRNFSVLSLNNTGRYLNLGSVRSMLRPDFIKQGLRTTGLLRSKT